MRKVLLLAALAAFSSLAPAAAAPPCTGSNEHWWTFATGFASGTYPNSLFPSPGFWTAAAAAQNVADAQCLQAWNNFAHNYSNSGDYTATIYDTPVGSASFRWKYRCKTCVTGFFPYPHHVRTALTPAQAGDVATGVVSGQVLRITLEDGDRPSYLVDVLSKNGQEQVQIDAETGEAKLVSEIPEGAFPVRE